MMICESFAMRGSTYNRCEGRIDIAAGAGADDMDLQLHGASS
jgi:hypothetical protein